MRVSFVSNESLKNIRRISVVRTGPDGGDVQDVYVRDDDDDDDSLKVAIVRPGLGVVRRLRLEKPAGGKKKQSRLLRPIEKKVRKLVKRELEIGNAYLERHERSNRREANGWIKNLPKNVIRAVRTDD
ncbi:MAG: hypothetical protein AB7P02_21755 [Alphaproteobacteria bacterium]